MVRQQPHGAGPRRYVDPRKFRELCGKSVHRVPGREGRWSGVRHWNSQADQERQADRGSLQRERRRIRRHVYKGGNMLHTIRQIVNNDEKWRGILRGLNKTFRHQVVSGKQVESYISTQAGIDLSKVFEEYLTTTLVPVLEYRINGSTLSYRWSDVVPGFAMPVKVSLSDNVTSFIYPTEQWKTAKLELKSPESFHVDENFYVGSRNADQPVASR